jgi:3-oxoacyl-[acyl-carrier-protein] synthase II
VGSLPSFEDYLVHPTTNLDHWDPDCHRDNLAIKKPKSIDKIDHILNNSFRTLDIRSVVFVGRLERQN